ncbi:MAG TPA: carbon-nitrogen hydrolase family protein [Deltaproteobacteria bacterium]|nr:carbon-nitrogen hydrolase family protein [Deltaproteobacteria bacterium]
MGTREIKVAVLQVKTMPGSSREEKVEHILPLIQKASEDGCQIIMPPELCTTDYEKFYTKDPEYFKLAEPVPGPTTEAVGELTKKYKNYVIMPLFEKKAPGIYYNSAPVVGPEGSVVGNYRKTQVAGVQVLEKLYFRQGNAFAVWETVFEPNAKFGTIICHDRRYPETSRILAMMGAEIMFCPTAAPGYAGGVHWELVNRARSVDNGMFTVYSNRIGTEWKKEYFGESMIVNPFGEVIANGGKDEDAVVSAVLDLDQVDEARIAVPTLRDLRNDFWMKYYCRPQYDELL